MLVWRARSLRELPDGESPEALESDGAYLRGPALPHPPESLNVCDGSGERCARDERWHIGRCHGSCAMRDYYRGLQFSIPGMRLVFKDLQDVEIGAPPRNAVINKAAILRSMPPVRPHFWKEAGVWHSVGGIGFDIRVVAFLARANSTMTTG